MQRRDLLVLPFLATGAILPMAAATMHSAANACDIVDFGAVADGKTLNTIAIQRAIDAAFRAGGGVVYVHPGTYLTGSIELKSRVTLYLEAGSVLLGSTRIEDYPFREGPPLHSDANGHHLLFARKAEDIAVCGLGVIDGQGEAFWRNVHRKPIAEQDLWMDVATYDYAPLEGNLRPSPMVELAECRNVRICGVTLRNSAGWTLRPVACETVVIDGVRIRNPIYGPNTDGIDITASRNVFVANCDIATGDDAICLKSENPYGELLPTKNITVTNCTLTTACNGFKIGTGTHGSFENIVFSNSVIYSDAASRLNARVIGGVCVEMVDGGSLDGVSVSNIRMQNVRTPIFVRLGRRTPNEGTFLRNVSVQGIDAEGAVMTSSITGVPGLRTTDVSVSDCRIRTVEAGLRRWASEGVPEAETAYPEARMFGRLPAYGLYVRHADRVRLRNLELICDAPDQRPALTFDDVHDAIVDGLEAAATPEAPVIEVRNTRRLFVSRTRLAPEGKLLLAVCGASSGEIALAANVVQNGQKLVEYRAGARVPEPQAS